MPIEFADVEIAKIVSDYKTYTMDISHLELNKEFDLLFEMSNDWYLRNKKSPSGFPI